MKTWIVFEEDKVVAWLQAEDEQEANIIAVTCGFHKYGEPAVVQCLDDLPKLD